MALSIQCSYRPFISEQEMLVKSQARHMDLSESRPVV